MQIKIYLIQSGELIQKHHLFLFIFPTEDVIQEALTLYQTSFKKPSYTVFALDFSGSMTGDGEEELKKAISTLLDQEKAKEYLLQAFR